MKERGKKVWSIEASSRFCCIKVEGNEGKPRGRPEAITKHNNTIEMPVTLETMETSPQWCHLSKSGHYHQAKRFKRFYKERTALLSFWRSNGLTHPFLNYCFLLWVYLGSLNTTTTTTKITIWIWSSAGRRLSSVRQFWGEVLYLPNLLNYGRFSRKASISHSLWTLEDRMTNWYGTKWNWNNYNLSLCVCAWEREKGRFWTHRPSG